MWTYINICKYIYIYIPLVPPLSELKLKDIAKAMGKLFASGASVSDTASGGKEIVIQGDVIEGVAAMLENKYQVRERGEKGGNRGHFRGHLQ